MFGEVEAFEDVFDEFEGVGSGLLLSGFLVVGLESGEEVFVASTLFGGWASFLEGLEATASVELDSRDVVGGGGIDAHHLFHGATDQGVVVGVVKP